MRNTLALAVLMILAAPALGMAAPSLQLAGPVTAAPRAAAASAAQVDGMCSRVVDGLWVRTDYFWHHGDYPRVVALDRIITETDPHFLEPYSTGGWLMESMGNTANAEAYYRLGVTNNPDEAYLRHQLGFFYFNTLKNYPKAIAAFQGATQQSDAKIESWKMLAHAYEKNKQLPEAVAVWQTLAVKYPDDAIVAHNLKRAQSQLATAQPPPPAASPTATSSNATPPAAPVQ